MNPEQEGRRRVVIEGIRPQVDGGRHPIKRVVGEEVTVEADIFADGHDVISAVLRHRHGADDWRETEMVPLGNDRWRASFPIERIGTYAYTVEAWVDRYKSWRRDLEAKAAAGQDQDAALDRSLEAEMERRRAERPFATRHTPELRVAAERVLARTGAWYELFPRSCGSDGRRHGTFRDLEAQLPRIAAMGFDILYLPPIHPIGRSHRKGRNNAERAGAEDPGSPWAIGSEEGGHTAVHPQLGTREDFRRVAAKARDLGLELALDIAFQCSPDHPYVREHPEWFRKRPDGTIQYAENPPKKYQDIYPFDFECEAWDALWSELAGVIEFWVREGVTVFRVDNPHTKTFGFWEWALGELKERHPELIFLSEAFTRPKPMHRLAKLGFTQSYCYFPWRNTADELRQFMEELIRPPISDYYRPNLWPNTPDILPQYLQFGGPPAFAVRLVLAATLGASYGIYGPAFELGVDAPRAPGEEEYLDSEKYELKAWNLDAPGSLEPLITRVNALRRENPALQSNDLLAFHPADNGQLLAYSKRTADRSNVVLAVVNLDARRRQAGRIELRLDELGIGADEPFQAHDLLSGARSLWRGSRQEIDLDPARGPAALFRIGRRLRTERDFDYFA